MVLYTKEKSCSWHVFEGKEEYRGEHLLVMLQEDLEARKFGQVRDLIGSGRREASSSRSFAT